MSLTPHVNPKCFHLSASSVSAFKACPQRFRLSYREGLRLVEDTESQRMGTNWHSMHEVYADAFAEASDASVQAMSLNLSAEECHDLALQQVVAHLGQRYEKIPAHKTAFEWNVERTILLMSFIGYQWYYQNDPVEVLASEVPFELPLHMPKSGMPLPMSEVVRIGKIDHVIRWQGMVGTLERKSTSRSIDPDSDYWDKAKKDTQVSMYALAFRDMQYVGGVHGDAWLRNAENEILIGPFEKGTRFGNTLYDVWCKPKIKPKLLSQAETTTFIETKVYQGQTFHVSVLDHHTDIRIDGETPEIEQGKKGFAIRETVGMFGARLLADIYERPSHYFVRREIARTDSEIRKFRSELFNLYQSQRMYDKTGYWWENEHQCRATFPCPFIPICYGPGADAVCDGQTTPKGFKRIFVDLTVHGEKIAEE